MITLRMSCTKCTSEFTVNLDVYRSVNIDTLPKRCPTCLDKIQTRPDVVLERGTIEEFVCRVHPTAATLLANAVEFQPLPTDKPSRRLIIKGERYGASWRGRIDVFSHVWPISSGDVVTLAYNFTRRQVWCVSRQIKACGYLGYVVERSKSYRVLAGHVPEPGESEVMEREETNEYVLLTRTLASTTSALQRDALPVLCWIEAYSKTTLKGLGNQFHRRIVGNPLWSLSVDGGCRSGRYGTHGMLAVVDPMDPVTVIGTGDLNDREVRYP